jgi:hypothetical protein
VAEVPGDGRYGFTVAVRGAGPSRRPPQAGERPQVWVEVDTTPPVVRLVVPAVGRVRDGGRLTLAWLATDKNLGARPVALFYAGRPEGPWHPIAADLASSGRYTWQLPAGIPPRLWLRVRATDRAGNSAVAQTPAPVIVGAAEAAEGEAVIRGVRPADKE